MANKPPWESLFDDIRKQSRQFEEWMAPYREQQKALEPIIGANRAEEFAKLFSNVLPANYLTGGFVSQGISSSTEVDAEVLRLRKDIREKSEALKNQAADSATKEREIESLRKDLLDLQSMQRLAHLLNHVGGPARERLKHDEEFQNRFQASEPCRSFVLAIDIRRSTELMLKAREPRLFAEFLINLAGALRDAVFQNYGVFDKFTGDGVLAIFPEFLTGADAGYRAVMSAFQCHALFREHYRRSRSSFSSVLLDTGLGIGIDHGDVQIVQIGGEFTVVGQPVVYACRMSGADAGQTLLNQAAYDQVFERYCCFECVETELVVKNEGRTAAYSVTPNGKTYAPAPPDWLQDVGTDG